VTTQISTNGAPISAGDKVLDYGLDDEVVVVEGVRQSDNGSWEILLGGDWHPLKEFSPLRAVHMYTSVDEGSLTLCAPCASSRRKAGEEVDYVSRLGDDHRHSCNDCDAFQPAKGEFLGW